jgi:hypothetical protein
MNWAFYPGKSSSRGGRKFNPNPIIASSVVHQSQRVSADGRFPDYQDLAGLLV